MPKRKYQRKTYNKGKKTNKISLGMLGKVALLGLFIGVFLFLGLFFYYAKDFPRPEMFSERQLVQSTKIYDRTGEVLLYEVYGEEKRTWVPLEEIPDHLQKAVLAAEDSHFYEHFGIDLKGIVRALAFDIQSGRPISQWQGGSTINQQLIRSTFLTLDKTIERKFREIILSLELDRRYPKEKILEWYLNQIPLGQNAYGVEAAAQTYFAKPVSQLSVAESAILASLIQAPYRLSPYGEEKENLMVRKNYVINRMLEEGFLDNESAEEAKDEELSFVEKKIDIKAPYFTLWVKQQLEENFGQEFLKRKGLKVYTSLDWELQQIAEGSLREGVENNRRFRAYNGGLVTINPQSGEVLALTVGTGDYYDSPYPEDCVSGVDCMFDPKFNVVIGAEKNPGRQPGSAFKPFVYATAFQKGYSDQHTVIDEPTSFGVWGGKEYSPRNYDGLFRGRVTLRSSLAQSLNVPSVKVLLNLAGLEDSIKNAEKMGIQTLTPPFGPSIVLGGWEVKLIEITSAYGVFANEGVRVPPVSILRIEDSAGNIIEQNNKDSMVVLEKEVARLINDILSDNQARAPMFGYNSPLYFKDHQVAVKTGTTQDYRDAWTIGYTPSLVTGVWVGNNNNAPMSPKPAASLAGPIFHQFMEGAIKIRPQKDFTPPDFTPTQEIIEEDLESSTTTNPSPTTTNPL
ncbi:MAG: PBP1A family penicillin-binding protein [Candidatus Nealsonbacteria bacterium]|nr:PBP1A family penicillin-binding protein [Candidatus Nealsonbacteria bacterium]